MNENQTSTLRWRYAGIIVATLFVAAAGFFYFCWGTQTTVLLGRHADRQGSADA